MSFKISEIFKSKYLRASDIGDRTVKVKIESAAVEEMADSKDQKPVLYFVGKDRGLVLNRTNAALLASRIGDDVDSWVGREIQLVSEPVNFQGRTVDGIRIKVPTAAPVQDFDDDIPF